MKFPRHDHGLLSRECAQKCGEVAADICTMVADQASTSPGCPRHPSQLYEAAMGFAILVLLLWLIATTARSAALGLFGSIFLVVYFSGRFTVEFVRVP
ncbi:MAG: prolipoprotein diacylglyceryl transferase [bacterium]